MWDDAELIAWCNQHDIPLSGREMIREIMKKPARVTQSRIGNVRGRYPSMRTGLTQQFESHRVELPGERLLDADKNVIAYWAQPYQIVLRYLSKTGRPTGTRYTPDFFVIYRDHAAFEEWKPESRLVDLNDAYPNRYCQDADGTWKCPPGDDYACKHGFRFHVRSSGTINYIYDRNLQILEDFIRKERLISDDIRENIYRYVQEHPGTTLACALQDILNVSVDDLYSALVQEVIYMNLESTPLTEHQNVVFFASKELAQVYARAITDERLAQQATRYPPLAITTDPGTPLMWLQQGVVVVYASPEQVILRDEQQRLITITFSEFQQFIQKGEILPVQQDTISQPSTALQDCFLTTRAQDWKQGLQRLKYLDDGLRTIPVSLRTERRWRKECTTARQAGSAGITGLIPKVVQRGNRQSRISDPHHVDLIINEIKEHYETAVRPSMSGTYRHYHQAALQGGYDPISYTSFRKRIQERPRYEQKRDREGKRAAYSLEVPYLQLEYGTPRHGDYPHHIGHIDHTKLGIELLHSMTGTHMGTPWATFMSDAFSRRFVVHLSYEEPSFRSDMMILREYVHHFGRLPRIVVTDNGSDFHSTYFEMLMAACECTIKWRPPSRPRHGALIESLFGLTEEQFINELHGNTQNAKHPRAMTRTVAPKELACWTLGDLYYFLRQWAYETWDTKEHPILGQSPREAYALGLLQAGTRAHISYQEETFRMMSMPPVRKGTAKVIPGRGVKVLNAYYMCDAFNDGKVANTQVHVRYDPYDKGYAYAFVHGKWTACRSEFFTVFSGRTHEEVRIATEELRHQNRLYHRNKSINAQELVRLLERAHEHEKILLQQLQDSELRQVFAHMHGKLTGPQGYQFVVHNGAASSLSAPPELISPADVPFAPSLLQALEGYLEEEE